MSQIATRKLLYIQRNVGELFPDINEWPDGDDSMGESLRSLLGLPEPLRSAAARYFRAQAEVEALASEI